MPASKRAPKSKPVNFDSMLKALVKSYDMPSKQDIEKLSTQIERLEKVIRQTTGKGFTMGTAKGAGLVDRSEMTASGTVLKVIKNSRQGADFAKIQEKTGFEDKKLRNIIFRLNKIGRIKRKTRGIYVVV